MTQGLTPPQTHDERSDGHARHTEAGHEIPAAMPDSAGTGGTGVGHSSRIHVGQAIVKIRGMQPSRDSPLMEETDMTQVSAIGGAIFALPGLFTPGAEQPTLKTLPPAVKAT